MEEGKELLLAALAAENLEVLQTDGKLVYLAYEYVVEIEGASLFKLSEEGYVVGPFGSAKELAAFVQQDLVVSGKSSL